jgi:hypothetical protein
MVAAMLTTVLAMAVNARQATAGQYHVYGCRTPDERPAPIDGWTGTTVPASSATVVAEDTCAGGGALMARLADGVKHEVGTSATWSFATPPGENIAAATLWRAGEANGGSIANAYYEFWLAGPNNVDRPPNVFDECVSGFSCPLGGIGSATETRSSQNMVVVPGSNLSTNLYVNASCGGEAKARCPEGKGDPNGYSAAVYLYAADVVLEDASPPTVVPGSVTGELASASTVAGKASLIFSAEDAGAGVYEATVSLDGTPVGSTALDANGGRCAEVGGPTDGLPGFLYRQPCASLATGDVQLDTTTLTDGIHRLTIAVQDAAGNSTVVVDRQVDVANARSTSGSTGGSVGGGTGSSGSPDGGASAQQGATSGAPNGSPATAGALLAATWASNGRSWLVGRWGHVQSLVGRLTTATGAPIAGALLEVVATPASQGAKAKLVGSPRTDAAGRFELRLAREVGSERIAVSYRAHLGDLTPAVVRVLSLTVPASLALKVGPRVSHAGGTIRFAGVLHGGPMPAGGKQVVLQARSPGQPWRTFQVLSTGRHGRYRANYRFRLPGPIVYRFRVICPHEADFPFVRGMSNVVKVRER